MSREEQAWSTRGEPTTTAYGANLSGKNEFGQTLAPKPVHNLHGIYTPSRPPVPLSDIFAMVDEFHYINGRAPTELFVSGPAKAERYRGFIAPGIGYVGLDIHYGAESTHVE